MSDAGIVIPDEREPAPGKRHITRLGFFGRVGAVGLAVAAGVATRGRPASASNWYCCNLIYVPPNCGDNWCVVNGDYNWYCTNPNGSQCDCCEAWGSCSSSSCG